MRLRRLGSVAALPLAVLPLVVLFAAPAEAAVSISYAGTDYDYFGDAAANAPVFACSGGNVIPTATPEAPCAEVETMFIDAHGGEDILNLTAVNATAFPKLVGITINSDEDSATDTVNGGPFGERYNADLGDLIFSGGGNDLITGGSHVESGDGNDVVDTAGGGLGIDLGAGDDRLLQTLSDGGIDGGPGDDWMETDFNLATQEANLVLVLTPTAWKASIPGVGGQDFPVKNFEHAVLTMPDMGSQTVNGSAFPGDLDVRGFGGPDTLIGTVKNDVLRGGTGNDTIVAFDKVSDLVDCGPGTDTAVVDKFDIVRGCENVTVGIRTSVVKGPKAIKKGKSGAFTFSSNVPGSVFQCKVDGKRWKGCKSPYSLGTSKLPKGKHTLQVRAGFPKGNWDTTPSKKAFSVT